MSSLRSRLALTVSADRRSLSLPAVALTCVEEHAGVVRAVFRSEQDATELVLELAVDLDFYFWQRGPSRHAFWALRRRPRAS